MYKIKLVLRSAGQHLHLQYIIASWRRARALAKLGAFSSVRKHAIRTSKLFKANWRVPLMQCDAKMHVIYIYVYICTTDCASIKAAQEFSQVMRKTTRASATRGLCNAPGSVYYVDVFCANIILYLCSGMRDIYQHAHKLRVSGARKQVK